MIVGTAISQLRDGMGAAIAIANADVHVNAASSSTARGDLDQPWCWFIGVALLGASILVLPRCVPVEMSHSPSPCNGCGYMWIYVDVCGCQLSCVGPSKVRCYFLNSRWGEWVVGRSSRIGGWDRRSGKGSGLIAHSRALIASEVAHAPTVTHIC